MLGGRIWRLRRDLRNAGNRLLIRARRSSLTGIRSRAVREYFGREGPKKLHLGSGLNLFEGWLNTDLVPRTPDEIYLDVRERFPFPDGVFDYVYSEHLIEHLVLEDGIRMLEECRRVLVPGGRIRIATPDLARIVGLYKARKSDTERAFAESSFTRNFAESGLDYRDALVVNNFCHAWGHLFIYDRPTLTMVLERAGFAEVTPREVGESDDPVFRGIEHHGDVIGEENNLYETFVVEAVAGERT